MLIVSLKEHFPARFPEWLNSGVLFSWGAYVALHPDLFTNPATAQLFSGLAEMTWGLDYNPAALWGLVGVVVALVRASALFVNGAYTRTPMIRLCMSFASAFIWAQVVIGFMNSGVSNTGLVVYGWLVVADIASAYRAGHDLALAEKQRLDRSTEIKRVGHHQFG